MDWEPYDFSTASKDELFRRIKRPALRGVDWSPSLHAKPITPRQRLARQSPLLLPPRSPRLLAPTIWASIHIPPRAHLLMYASKYAQMPRRRPGKCRRLIPAMPSKPHPCFRSQATRFTKNKSPIPSAFTQWRSSSYCLEYHDVSVAHGILLRSFAGLLHWAGSGQGRNVFCSVLVAPVYSLHSSAGINASRRRHIHSPIFKTDSA